MDVTVYNMQGAEVDPRSNQPDERTTTDWLTDTRTLDSNSVTGVRWLILLYQDRLPPGSVLEVQSVRILFEG